MKKTISAVLCLSMIFSFFTMNCSAENISPTVYVAGYTESRMWLDRGTENEQRVWKLDVAEKALDAVKKEIPNLLLHSGGLVVGYTDALFEVLLPYVNEIIEPLRMNPDGTSVYPVEVYPHSVSDTRLDKIAALGYVPDSSLLNKLAETVGKKNIYCCTLDWRYGQVDNAAVLDSYIRDVLSVTGAEKVNIMGTSYGGQIVSCYLSLYGGEYADHVVLHCPALGGTDIAATLLSGESLSIAWTDALRLYQAFAEDPTDYAAITEIITPDCLNSLVRKFVDYYFADFFVNFGSIWDFVPLEKYEQLRDTLLADENHRALAEKSNRYHYEVAANLKTTLRSLREDGVKISVIVGCDNGLVTNKNINSDGVIPLYSAAGVADENDYRNGYLPDNTWYVRDLFHAMAPEETKLLNLIRALLFTDSVTDVHASKEYPQFMISRNKAMHTVCDFSSCSEGYFTPYATELTVTNISEFEIVIYDITCDGADLKFSFDRTQSLAPGESVTAVVYGTLPDDGDAIRVQTDYVLRKDDYSIADSRTQSFRYSDGALYDEILTVDWQSGLQTISQNGESIKSTPDTDVLFARILHFFYKMIAVMCAKVRSVFGK